MIKYKAWKWRTRLRLKHSIFRLNIIFRSLNFFRRITPKSPSSHTGHLFLSIPLPHLCPFSALSDSAVTPPKLKIKATSWNGNGVDKVHPFNQFFVNSVIVGEAFPIEKTQKIKRIQPIWCTFRIRRDCNADGDCVRSLDKVKTWDAALIRKMKLSELNELFIFLIVFSRITGLLLCLMFRNRSRKHPLPARSEYVS